MKDQEKTKKQFISPVQLVTIIALLVFVSEVFVMIIISFLRPFSTLFEALLDSTLLVVLLSPMLYFFSFRPLVLHITERKRAEESLQESKEKYRLLVESSRETIIVAQDGMLKFFNSQAMEITGYSREELASKPFVELIYPDDREMVVERHLKRLKGESLPHVYPFRIIERSGNIKWVEINAVLITWEGKPATLNFLSDITERKQAEEALRGSEQFLQDTFDGIQDGISVLDGDLNIMRVNAWMKRMYASHAPLVGKKCYAVYQQRESPCPWCPSLPAMETGESHSEIVPYPSKEDPTGWIDLSAYPLKDITGHVVGVIEHVKDITERKRAEEALQKYSEHLEEMVEERTKELRDAQEQLVRKEKLAVLGQLAGGVGHELRNPLGVISNAVYFLQLTLPDADEPTKEYLEIISEEVRNSAQIVSDLLDFSRTRMPEREEVAVSELVAEALEKQPPPEEVEVSTEIAPDLLPVYVDPQQMGQVLGNLVTNACQAMKKEGGKLTISAQAEKDQVHLSVSDTGCGISQENLPKIFEPLFTTKARGIGLGLATSRILVEANGGSIEVESEEGKGSTFTVILPSREVVA